MAKENMFEFIEMKGYFISLNEASLERFAYLIMLVKNQQTMIAIGASRQPTVKDIGELMEMIKTNRPGHDDYEFHQVPFDTFKRQINQAKEQAKRSKDTGEINGNRVDALISAVDAGIITDEMAIKDMADELKNQTIQREVCTDPNCTACRLFDGVMKYLPEHERPRVVMREQRSKKSTKDMVALPGNYSVH